MTYVGADGCKGGWLTVILSAESGWQVEVFPDIFSLWDRCKDARLILLDVPIGLPDENIKHRMCDKEARKLLGSPRRASVFPAPSREVVYAYAKSYDEAKEINATVTGKKLSKQSYKLVPRVLEVDKLLSSDEFARSCIKETHPEVCFWAFNGSTAMQYPKNKKVGFQERMGVLNKVYSATEEIVDYALKLPRQEVAKDDILDALAAAVTASAVERGLTVIPQKAESDSRGLPMEMVYYCGTLG